jgi:uncharacterized protein YqgC (DUF456 family)
VPFIAAGFVGLVLPVLPDTILIFCGFLLFEIFMKIQAFFSLIVDKEADVAYFLSTNKNNVS